MIEFNPVPPTPDHNEIKLVQPKPEQPPVQRKFVKNDQLPEMNFPNLPQRSNRAKTIHTTQPPTPTPPSNTSSPDKKNKDCSKNYRYILFLFLLAIF